MSSFAKLAVFGIPTPNTKSCAFAVRSGIPEHKCPLRREAKVDVEKVQAYARATIKERSKFKEPVSVSDQNDGVVLTHPKIQARHCTNKRQIQQALRDVRVEEAKG